MDELSRLPGKSLLFAIDVSGDEILHVFGVRFQDVAGDIETENVDDLFVRCDFSSDCKKENFPIQIFFFTFGLRYLEDRSGVEVVTKMFVFSMFAKKM